SGNYGWPGERCLVEVRHFNKDGKITGRDFPTTVGHEARTTVEVEDGEAVVLERLPATVSPKSGAARINAARCAPDSLSWTIESPAGARIRASHGRFRIAPNAICRVTLGDATRHVSAGKDGALVFDVPRGGPHHVILTMPAGRAVSPSGK
ncbi:MAG: hypothetical protein N2689_05675, partial [Verrucomicrobiae bacterium]|nr:hypothetical protein [Verrucomicrobiae bacterium]